MVIGRTDVMDLLIRSIPRIDHSYNIQDHAVRYITPFDSSPNHQSLWDLRTRSSDKKKGREKKGQRSIERKREIAYGDETRRPPVVQREEGTCSRATTARSKTCRGRES